jgi:RNA-directed DNA polymerase
VYRPETRRELAAALAFAMLAGRWEARPMAVRARRALDRRVPWLPAVVADVLEAYVRPPADRPRELTAYIEILLDERPATRAAPPRVRRWFTGADTAMGRRRWAVPELDSPGGVAAWLGIGASELEWFADVRGLERRAADERLRHYRYGWITRDSGRVRALERPKPRLKALQRRVLHEILDLIPAHPAAHGFTRGRSARTHAAVHVGRPVVIGLDLEDFFASVPARRVFGIFRAAGYPEAVAHALTGLCTNAMPVDVWARLPRPRDPALIAPHHRLGRRLATPHLPQGAPTSPALANLAAFGLDRRLAGLATAFATTYSRYADDLTFSGGHARDLRRIAVGICADEGFRVNPQKSRLVTRAGRQRVCGIVVNERLNVDRREYDRLKAVLHDLRLHGPAAANRAAVPDFRAHLLGRIAWVASLNPGRGEKLRAAFDASAGQWHHPPP